MQVMLIHCFQRSVYFGDARDTDYGLSKDAPKTQV